jgi:hypothetical protein
MFVDRQFSSTAPMNYGEYPIFGAKASGASMAHSGPTIYGGPFNQGGSAAHALQSGQGGFNFFGCGGPAIYGGPFNYGGSATHVEQSGRRGPTFLGSPTNYGASNSGGVTNGGSNTLGPLCISFRDGEESLIQFSGEDDIDVDFWCDEFERSADVF